MNTTSSLISYHVNAYYGEHNLQSHFLSCKLLQMWKCLPSSYYLHNLEVSFYMILRLSHSFVEFF